MDKGKSNKKIITLTNIMAFFMVILYILDRWIVPFPENYNGFKWEDSWKQGINLAYGEDYLDNLDPEIKEGLETARITGGYCGGVITNALGIIDTNVNPNGNSFYRNFTLVFTHGFHLHLITNVIAFLIIGNYIEKKFRSIPMVILFFLTDVLGVPITNMVFPPVEGSMVIAGASGGIFGLLGIGFAMCLLNLENFKDFSKLKKIYLIIYGVVPTYIISFGWTTVVHNISFAIGMVLAFLLNFILPKFKEIVHEKKKEEVKEEIKEEIKEEVPSEN